MRKMLLLPEQDQCFLKSIPLPWETIIDSGMQWILLHNYIIPEGYNVKNALVAIMIPPGYPIAQLDMAYFYPGICRLDNKPIRAVTLQKIDGKPFQRWSRHRTSQNPWRPGIDDLSTHISLIDHWLDRELRK